MNTRPLPLPPSRSRGNLLLALLHMHGTQTNTGFDSPSKIQRKAIPQILNGGNVVFAAATGSGKTLAYLMPLVQQLRAQEVRCKLRLVESGIPYLMPGATWDVGNVGLGAFVCRLILAEFCVVLDIRIFS